MRSDFSLNCDMPIHQSMQLYASCMIFLYTVGTPSLYAYLFFFKFKEQLVHLQMLEQKASAQKTTRSLQSKMAEMLQRRQFAAPPPTPPASLRRQH